jgi:periplasmic protein TonB
MSRRLGVWLLVSLMVHLGLVGIALAVLRTALPAMLFVDLAHGLLTPPVPGGHVGREGPAESPAAAPRGAAPAAPVASSPRAERPRGAPPPPAPRREAPPSIAPPSAPAPVTDSPPEVTARPAPPDSAPAAARPAPEPPAARPGPVERIEAPPAPSTERAGPSPQTAGAHTSLLEPSTGGGTSAERGAGGGGPTADRNQGREGSDAGPGPGVRDGAALALAIPGDGGGGDATEYAGYYATLHSRILEALRYPAAARRRGLAGTVQIEVEIEPTGAFARVALAASSSHRVLDDAALDAVRDVGRLPFPSGVRPRPLRVRIPVVFELR